MPAATRVLVVVGAGLADLGETGAGEGSAGPGDPGHVARIVEEAAAALGLSAQVDHCDDEVDVARLLAQAARTGTAVVFDPGVLAAYSYALRAPAQLVTAAGLPLIEVQARGVGGGPSEVAAVATGTVSGFGEAGYEVALRAVAALSARDAG